MRKRFSLVALCAPFLALAVTETAFNTPLGYLSETLRPRVSARAISGEDRPGVDTSDVEEDERVSRYIELLERPERAWERRTDPEPAEKPRADGGSRLRTELDEMLASYAPRIWWHSSDPFGPMDPLEFVRGSSLWHRDESGRIEQLVPKGSVIADELGRNGSALYSKDGISPDHPSASIRAMGEAPEWRTRSGFFLKYENPDFGTKEIRNWNWSRLSGRSYRQSIRQGEVPIFWRVSERRPGQRPNQVLIEYWYHVAYSHATRIGIGNHQGDWEGIALVVDLGINSEDRLVHRPVSVFYSAHGGGKWYCPSDLEWAEGRPEAYTALGSHATYPRSGVFLWGAFLDATARGRNWDSWKNVRPLELEPYYGYAGAWGDVHYFDFMSGPNIPGPGFKPMLPSGDDSETEPPLFASKCGAVTSGYRVVSADSGQPQ